MKVTRQNARRQLPEKAFEETRDCMRVPILIRRQQVDVALCERVTNLLKASLAKD